MNVIRNTAQWVLIGGGRYPGTVEDVISGELQGRLARVHDGERGVVMVHPNYMFQQVAHTLAAIRGAFTLRLLDLSEDITPVELEEKAEEVFEVPQLNYLGCKPVRYEDLGIVDSLNFLRITRLVSVKDGVIKPSERAAKMIEANPWQAYTVHPYEWRQNVGVDVGPGYAYVPAGGYGVRTAHQVFAQYSPHYPNATRSEA